MKQHIFQDCQLPNSGCLEGGEEVTLPAMLPVMTGTPGSTKWAGPDLGHHTEEVLKEQLNLDDASLLKLRQQKVI